MKKEIAVFDISKEEVSQATETLIAAFEEDAFIQCVCGVGVDSIEARRVFFSAVINYCRLYGRAYRTENFESVGCRLLPAETQLNFWRMLRSGMLKIRGCLGKDRFNNLMKISDEQNVIVKKYLADTEYLYCWVLGTHPDKQRQGFGGAIMRKTFNLARSLNVPCYLETFTESVISAHKHNGYVELTSHSFEDLGLSMHCMLNDVKSTDN